MKIGDWVTLKESECHDFNDSDRKYLGKSFEITHVRASKDPSRNLIYCKDPFSTGDIVWYGYRLEPYNHLREAIKEALK